MVPMACASTWEAEGKSQLDLMNSDQCVVVDFEDKIERGASKLECHTFSEGEPRGVLHRAFSVFYFDQEDRLLLQQRASDKITFPGVWTNTCCSHQLTGFEPSEVDTDEDVRSGKVPGAKRAAVRKLKHELGVDGAVGEDDFTFVTRLHYWAADTETHGAEAPWGEHEIDYILLAKGGRLACEPNPEEVQATRWVTQAELREMMEDPALTWSPWFRIIATDERFLPRWWGTLADTLATGGSERDQIHRFDPMPVHQGGAGGAGPWLG